jgi:hypothetical protein
MKRLVFYPLAAALVFLALSCGGGESEVAIQPSSTALPTVKATPSPPPPATATVASPPTPTAVPQPSATPAPDFTPFAQDWGHHGFGITVTASGEATATWRVYKWCSDDPTPPCDNMIGNEIISGGHATIVFDRVDGDTAYGRVQDSTDEATLSGNVSLTLQDYDMSALEYVDLPESEPIVLCGPDYLQEAPDWLIQQSPCGA